MVRGIGFVTALSQPESGAGGFALRDFSSIELLWQRMLVCARQASFVPSEERGTVASNWRRDQASKASFAVVFAIIYLSFSTAPAKSFSDSRSSP